MSTSFVHEESAAEENAPAGEPAGSTEPARSATQAEPVKAIEPAKPAEPATSAEPAKKETEPPAAAKDGGAPEGLADETVASDVNWAREHDRRSQQAEEGLRSFGVDPDDLRRAAPLDTGTGPKVATGAWAMAAEQIQNHFAGPQPNRARNSRLAAGQVESVEQTHVPTGGHELLRHTVLRHNVAYLSGQDGSGRSTTAHVVLAEVHGHDGLVVIDLNEDADLAAVLDQDGMLLPGHGHVLELPAHRPAPRKQTLAAVGGRLAECGGRLIVIGPPEQTLDPYEVAHQPPEPWQLLARHLTHLLRTRAQWSADRAEEFVRTCHVDDDIAAQLRASWRPCEVVRLARRLVEVARRGGPPAEAVQLLPGALRELATTVLREANSDVDPLRTLTARVTYAVFNGRPLTVVFDLASDLFGQLPQEERTEQPVLARTVFDGGMESLVDPRMRAAPTDDNEEGDRLATLVDPELAGAVLDVLWHDYDHMRAPFLRWLHRLGGDHRQSVRMRAGQVAGQLALYDFGVAYRELLRPWAASERRTHRESAAWAMARAVLEPRLTARVCNQVRDWTYSHHPFLNDTSARCYATRLGAEYEDDALLHLLLVALRGEQAVSHAVAQAVAQLYRPESGPAILAELTRWAHARERCLHVHAARALTFLAQREAPAPDDDWPDLLRTARDDTEVWALLIELWRTALTEFMTAARGWAVLLMWLLGPTEDGELRDVTTRFATELLSAPMVRARARFHLNQWLPRHEDSPVLWQLRDNLREG
jgi:hypothetical protein